MSCDHRIPAGGTVGGDVDDAIPARAAALKPFSGHIYLAVGDSDEFDLYAPTAAFSKTLTEAGIANELMVTHGGHGNRPEHLAAIAKFCAAKLEPAK